MKLLHLVLILEWPILVIALALSSWCLSFIIIQVNTGDTKLYTRQDNEFIPHSKAILSTSKINTRPLSTVAGSTHIIDRASHPDDLKSTVGSIPTFDLIPEKLTNPNQSLKLTPQRRNDESIQLKSRAYWADYRNVYGYEGERSGIFPITFIILVIALAVRVILTPIYLLHFRFGDFNRKQEHSWNIALVTITIIFTLMLWGIVISGFYFYCDTFADTIYKSVGLIVTIIFCGLACLSSVFSFVLMCMEVDKSRKASYHAKVNGSEEAYAKESLTRKAGFA